MTEWTKELPSKDGYYWVRVSGNPDEIVSVELDIDEGRVSEYPIYAMGSDYIFKFSDFPDALYSFIPPPID